MACSARRVAHSSLPFAEGSDLERAELREIAEESGLTSIRLVRKLAEAPEPAWGHVRHVLHFEIDARPRSMGA